MIGKYVSTPEPRTDVCPGPGRGRDSFLVFCSILATIQALSLGLVAGGVGSRAVDAGAALGEMVGPFGAAALAFGIVLCTRSALRHLGGLIARELA